MVDVKTGSTEGRILRVLLEKYPVDIDTISSDIGSTKKETYRILRGMEERGWLTLEKLPDRTFVRLRRFDFRFVGRDETQRKAIKHKKGNRKKKRIKKKLLRDEHDDMMYA